MDSFLNSWHKIGKLDKQSKENEIELSKLTPDFKKSNVREYVIKTPKVLYDSGWVNKNTGSSDGTPYSGGTHYLTSSFVFEKELNISREQLPFVKPIIMVKSPPGIDSVGLFTQTIGYIGATHTGNSYTEVEGDGSPIYKGYNSRVENRTEQQLLDGEFPVNKTTKWWQGEDDELGEVFSLTFISGGISNRWHNATIDYLQCTWDTVDMGDGRFDNKIWKSTSFTDITGSSVSGYGIYIKNTWTEISEDVWELNTAVIYGFKSNIPIFQDNTSFHCHGGSAEYWDGSNWQSASNVRTIENSDTVTKFEFFESEFYMLHWATNKLGPAVLITSSGLARLPTEIYFETPPYSNITHKVNPGEHPIPQSIDELVVSESLKSAWLKTEDENIYKFIITGNFLLVAPATKYIGDTHPAIADVWDDNYASSIVEPSIINWEKTENHSEKENDFYRVEYADVQVKLLMTLLPQTNVIDVKSIKES